MKNVLVTGGVGFIGSNYVHSLRDGLRETVQWYLSNTEWIAAIRAQQEYQQWFTKNYAKRENE